MAKKLKFEVIPSNARMQANVKARKEILSIDQFTL